MRAKKDVDVLVAVPGYPDPGKGCPPVVDARTRPIGQVLALLLMSLVLEGVTGCASPPEAPNLMELETVDGLKARQIDAPGRLFLRDDHQIGAYDAFLISESSVSYDRQSRVLPEIMEASFLAALEQSLYDAAEEAQIPIVDAPGTCVMEVGMRLTDVVVDRAGADRLGTMTLVMEFRDTDSGAPLLRYATQNSIDNEGMGIPRSEQFQAAFEGMVAEMEISGALRAAGLTNNATRPGCRGTLAERGRSGLPAVSAY